MVGMRGGWMALLLALMSGDAFAAPASRRHEATAEVIRLWPGQAPGSEDWQGPEEVADVTLPAVGKLHVITNVTVPTLTVFRPSAADANGTAMIVLPGGSFRALAWDVDGVETAQWLAKNGVTAFVLKYRVRPPQKGESFGETLADFARATRSRRALAVADARQAIRYVRTHAQTYRLRRGKIGIIGFSAGAMATAEIALGEEPSARPDFAIVMYGAALDAAPPPAGAPPIFIGAAQDDPQLPASNSIDLYERWTKAGLPAELHIYENGGHGFGFRHHGTTSDSWPSALRAWLAGRRLIAE